jgi:hypothetical protein
MLCMDAAASHTLTMQVTWVVTVQASKFFSQMVLQADLEDARPICHELPEPPQ